LRIVVDRRLVDSASILSAPEPSLTFGALHAPLDEQGNSEDQGREDGDKQGAGFDVMPACIIPVLQMAFVGFGRIFVVAQFDTR
jgi:hypothetical protein